MRRVVALLALTVFASPVFACDNSSELPKYEREFRSQYRSNSPSVMPTVSPSGKLPMMFLGGGVLLTGAVTATVVWRRK